MKFKMLTLATASLLAVAMPAAADAAKPVLGTWGYDQSAMNSSVKPGDDFWAYVKACTGNHVSSLWPVISGFPVWRLVISGRASLRPEMLEGFVRDSELLPFDSPKFLKLGRSQAFGAHRARQLSSIIASFRGRVIVCRHL